MIGPFDHRSRRRNRVTYGKVVREEKRKNTLNTKWKVLIVLLRRIQRRAVYSAKVSEFSIKRYTIEDGSNRDSSIESSIRVDQGGRKEGSVNWARIKRYVSEDLWNPSSRAKRIIQKRIERKQAKRFHLLRINDPAKCFFSRYTCTGIRSYMQNAFERGFFFFVHFISRGW